MNSDCLFPSSGSHEGYCVHAGRRDPTFSLVVALQFRNGWRGVVNAETPPLRDEVRDISICILKIYRNACHCVCMNTTVFSYGNKDLRTHQIGHEYTKHTDYFSTGECTITWKNMQSADLCGSAPLCLSELSILVVLLTCEPFIYYSVVAEVQSVHSWHYLPLYMYRAFLPCHSFQWTETCIVLFSGARIRVHIFVHVVLMEALGFWLECLSLSLTTCTSCLQVHVVRILEEQILW